MSSKAELDSFIIQCAKKYAEKHPDEKVTARKEIEIPLDDCQYCNGSRELYGVPFGTEIMIKGNSMAVFDGSSINIPIRYCPMCGREL